MSEPIGDTGPTTESTDTSPANDVGSAAETQGGGNPAWQPAFDALNFLPTEFVPKVREALTPYLTQQDQSYRQMQDQYGAFKPFVDQGINPERLTQANQLFTALDTDPLNFYNQFRQTLINEGHSLEDATAIADQVTDDGSGEDDGPDDPRFARMQQELQAAQEKAEQFEEYIQNQQRETSIKKYEDNFRTEMEKLPAGTDKALVGRFLSAQIADGRQDVSVQSAHQEYLQFMQTARQVPANGAPAPRIMPAGGGMPPTTTKNPADMTAAERAEFMAQRLSGHNT